MLVDEPIRFLALAILFYVVDLIECTFLEGQIGRQDADLVYLLVWAARLAKPQTQ